MFLLPVRMKKIQSKINVQEWAKHYSMMFKTLNMAANSKVGDGILPKFKLIEAIIVVLVTNKNKEDPFKIVGTREVTTFLPF